MLESLSTNHDEPSDSKQGEEHSYRAPGITRPSYRRVRDPRIFSKSATILEFLATTRLPFDSKKGLVNVYQELVVM